VEVASEVEMFIAWKMESEENLFAAKRMIQNA